MSKQKFNRRQRESLIDLANKFLIAEDPDEKNKLRRKLMKRLGGGDMYNLEELCEDIVYQARARDQGGLHW
jgi:hypothetical protein